VKKVWRFIPIASRVTERAAKECAQDGVTAKRCGWRAGTGAVGGAGSPSAAATPSRAIDVSAVAHIMRSLERTVGLITPSELPVGTTPVANANAETARGNRSEGVPT